MTTLNDFLSRRPVYELDVNDYEEFRENVVNAWNANHNTKITPIMGEVADERIVAFKCCAWGPSTSLGATEELWLEGAFMEYAGS